MSNMLLEAKELHTYYGASHILHGIDFHIRQGEGIALMGRNGMGKTTLLKTLMGLIRARGGALPTQWTRRCRRLCQPLLPPRQWPKDRPRRSARVPGPLGRLRENR